MPPPLAFLWSLVAGAIVLGLPGIAWLAWFPERNKDLPEYIAEAIGLSIAVTALAALVAFLLGWHASAVVLVFLYALVGAAALLGLARRAATWDGWQRPFMGNLGGRLVRSSWHNPLILVVFAAILAWRFYQVRELVLPAWVDSVHHVLIVRVVQETGGVPEALDPYLPVPFYYHFAFHVLAAILAFLANLAPQEVVLWFGQVLNAAVAFSVYRLGMSLWGGWRRAGLAAGLVGFVTQMPAYYATWGRYTLLTGLVLLPLAMAVALDVIHEGATPQRISRLAVLTGGVLLAHYFAGLLLALFLVFLGAPAVLGELRQGFSLRTSRLISLVGGVVGGALLAAAWIFRVWSYARSSVSVEPVLPTQSIDELYFPDYLPYLWRMLGPNRNYLLLTLAIIGLVLAVRHAKTRPLALWVAALGLLSVPWGLRLSPFRPDHVVIVLFLPAALLAAELFLTSGEVLDSGRLAVFGKISLVAALLSLLVWGLWDTRFIINRSTILADEADLEAIQWIAENTPSDARFFVNAAPWLGRTYRGVDGGWWITPITRRETVVPPVIYAFGERDYVDQVTALVERASRVKSCTPEFWELVREAGLTHVYIGGDNGSLRPEGLADCPGVAKVYGRQGVYIYQIAESTRN